MNLLPDCHFFIVLEDQIRVAALKRRTSDGLILAIFQNDDEAWCKNPIWDSYFMSESDLIFLEGSPNCTSLNCQACLADIPCLPQFGSHVLH